MSQSVPNRSLPWLEPGEAFPPVYRAWGPQDPAPGLLAAGGVLDVPTLVAAYSQGIFPWFSEGQPILWWSTDPRMVLNTQEFRLHRSLRKTIQGLLRQGRLQIRFDHNFEQVIRACAETPRGAQHGTWILPVMQQAYLALHAAGVAHSVEVWIDGALAGGLYGVNLGGMVFGESMFSRQNNASKIALAALVAFCRAHEMSLIDCQQDTAHLASLGARTLARAEFVERLQPRLRQPAPVWAFEPVYWQKILDSGSIAS
jgi:leucyl/phenylalanyl-tRNA--protein transferase